MTIYFLFLHFGKEAIIHSRFLPDLKFWVLKHYPAVSQLENKIF